MNIMLINMNISVNENGSSKIALVSSSDVLIRNTQDALDLMATVRFTYGCNKIIINKAAIIEDFFDLKTRIAGEILQKYTNYNIKIGIVGNFENYSSKSLQDFIYESNKGNQVLFLPDEEAAIKRLHSFL